MVRWAFVALFVLLAAVLVAAFGGAAGHAAPKGHKLRGAHETRTGCPTVAITTLPATDVTSTSATLNGQISGGCFGQTYEYQFGYGTSGNDTYFCSDYDVCTSSQQVRQNSEILTPIAVSEPVSGLTPDTTYHFQLFLICKCAFQGGDLTLQTLPEPTTTTTTTTTAPPPPPPKPPADPHADLAVSVTPDRTSPQVGDTLTYTVAVRNRGPREATNVTLTNMLPAQVSFVSVSGSAPATARRLQDAVPCSGGPTVTCHIGVLGFGSVSTTTIVTRVIAAGDAIDTAVVSNPDQPDPNGANSTGTSTVSVPPPPTTTTTTGAVAPPVYGQTFDIRPVSGTVLIRLPGTTTFVPLTSLTSIPEGSEIDTTNGRVEITSASDPANDRQTAQFYDGRFILLYSPPDIGTAPQPPGTVSTLVTSLVLSAPLACPTAKTKRTAAAGSQTAKKKVRILWGTGKGSFRTRGRYAAATVRGTIWFTQDTCTATTVRVRQGIVDVYDVVLNRHFLVGPGRSHTAHKRP